MADAAETAGQTERCIPIPKDERVLTEVDQLTAHAREGGSYDPRVLQDVFTNLVTATKEAAMPYSVSTVEHEYRETDRGGTYTWLGRTAVEAAASGYRFHDHDSARQRVGVEVDEARYAEEDQKPGTLKVFISPRMSRKDAPEWVAREEHLADDDAIRISWLEADSQGRIEKKVLQSILVRDIPLGAWVGMLKDPNNIFGKSIEVDDPDSALSVMEKHREMELPMNALPEGPVSIVEAVLPYINDPFIANKVREQLARFRGNQADMHEKAETIAAEWLRFEEDLAQSLHTGFASQNIKNFIYALQEHWGDEALDTIRSHQIEDGELRMSRKLAIVLEGGKRNTLWASAGVLTGNDAVLEQISPEAAEKIIEMNLALQSAEYGSERYWSIMYGRDRLIAQENIETGGGCPGLTSNVFSGDKKEKTVLEEFLETKESKKSWKWKKGICVIKECPTRPGSTDVGPCDVCRGCQACFDKGEDPAARYRAKERDHEFSLAA